MVIERPKDFKFTAGDYIYIRIPDIALFEWHPFTISSAPELKGLSGFFFNLNTFLKQK